VSAATTTDSKSPKKPAKRAKIEAEETTTAPPAKKARASKTKAQAKLEESEEEDEKPTPKKARGKTQAAEDDADAVPAKAARGKGKAWPPPELDPSDNPPRAGHPIFALPPLSTTPNGAVSSTSSSPRPHLLGAHTSIAGGPATALYRSAKAGANGLAMFVKSQRQWKSNPYEQEAIDRFRTAMKSVEDGGLGYGPEAILVHGSYLINLGNPDQAKWNTSYACFKDDLQRCHQLGVKLYNWQ
jgi:AP endonuclease-1